MNRLTTKFLMLGALAVFGFAGSAQAQTVRTQDVTANIGNAARLDLSRTTVVFADSDPDAVPLIDATGGVVNITAKARIRSTQGVVLTVESNGNLVDGANSIGIANVKYLLGGFFVGAGDMVANPAAVTVGTWSNSGTRNGTVLFRLANSYDYVVGTYTAQFTYTLTVQ